MSLTKTCFLAVLLVGSTLWAIQASADTEVWQDVWQEKGSVATPQKASAVNWEDRALKRPLSARPTAQRWVSPRTAQQSSYDQEPMETIPLPEETATPIQKHTAPAQPSAEGAEVIEPGAVQFEAIPPDSIFSNAPAKRACGDCDACEECAADDKCDFGWPVFDGSCGPFLRGLSVFGGLDAFKGPLDRGTNGNFGVNEGLNLARPLGDPWGCGYQIGANFVQTDFSGAPAYSADGRNYFQAPFRKQYFATAGIFRRAQGHRGFQWGIAYDYLHDIYYDDANLQQVRSETCFVLNAEYEIGYYGVYGVGGDKDRVIDGRLDPTDMFILYVRKNFENGGDGRVWAGATGNGDGLIGADLWVPLGKSFALENRINYMIPKQGRGETAQTRESWGLLIQLVWYPGQNAKCQQQNPYRPIFNVADNSLFMVDRLTH
jgi:hypothetical protein